MRIPRPPAFETAATSSGTPTLNTVRVEYRRDEFCRKSLLLVSRVWRLRWADRPLHATLHNGPINTTADHGVNNPRELAWQLPVNSHPNVQQLGQWRGDRHCLEFRKRVSTGCDVEIVVGSNVALMTWMSSRYDHQLRVRTRSKWEERKGRISIRYARHIYCCRNPCDFFFPVTREPPKHRGSPHVSTTKCTESITTKVNVQACACGERSRWSRYTSGITCHLRKVYPFSPQDSTEISLKLDETSAKPVEV